MSTLAPTFSRRLERAHPLALAVYAGLAAFTAYCSMYGLRKPFTAAAYSGLMVAGMHFKIALVICQVGGYALSKFIGIRLISGLPPARRPALLLGLLLVAELALLGFALTPYPYNAVWLFVNGLPLGLVWGLVFGFIEGRRTTELLAAVLSANFIVSSGLVKSLGQVLLQRYGIPEFWMPFTAGLVFLLPLMIAVWMLARLPAPTYEDRAARMPRTPMDAADRRALWRRYAPGLTLLIVVYLALTVLRDLRDNFAVEIWTALGYGGQPAMLTVAELPVTLVVLLGLAALIVVRDNRRAFLLNQWLIIGGATLLAISTLAFRAGHLAPIPWMIVSGAALFLPYIVFNGMLFERLLAAFREPGNVGFLMYAADTVGYLGSVAVLLTRNFAMPRLSWLDFYTSMCLFVSGAAIVIMTVVLVYFKRKI